MATRRDRRWTIEDGGWKNLTAKYTKYAKGDGAARGGTLRLRDYFNNRPATISYDRKRSSIR